MQACYNNDVLILTASLLVYSANGLLFPLNNGNGKIFTKSYTKTRLSKYINIFSKPKRMKFSDKKNYYIFHISAQNIDCGYSLEPPRRDPQFKKNNLKV